ncbi:MAG: ribonuclease III family protein [Spirulinaceae cyanobacterium RM2_2_10]|nr:ribonuclease III family protein [Spirulinaceae cyanobacterium RM2_2_10]
MTGNRPNIEDKIGLNFKHPEILFLALSHPSYAKLAGEPGITNERLDFLGATILELSITTYFYQYCPYLKVANWQGLLPKLTENERLTKLWFQLNLGNSYPFLDLEEERSSLRQKKNNPFVPATRALVAAIHCDRGFTQARNWLYKHLIAPMLAKHLKKIQKRVEPETQLRFIGRYLLPAIVTDYLYTLLPHVTPQSCFTFNANC